MNGNLTDLTCLIDKQNVLKFLCADEDLASTATDVELTVCSSHKVNRKCFAKVSAPLISLLGPCAVTATTVYIELAEDGACENSKPFPRFDRKNAETNTGLQ